MSAIVKVVGFHCLAMHDQSSLNRTKGAQVSGKRLTQEMQKSRVVKSRKFGATLPGFKS